MVGRDLEIRQVMQTLTRRRKNNPVIIGEAEVGKTAIAEGLAQRIASGDVPESLRGRRFQALERRFQAVYLEEPTVEETVEILKVLRPRYEAHHNVDITDAALAAAARFSDRYITGRQLPDEAVDFIDEAASKLRIDAEILPAALPVRSSKGTGGPHPPVGRPGAGSRRAPRLRAGRRAAH